MGDSELRLGTTSKSNVTPDNYILAIKKIQMATKGNDGSAARRRTIRKLIVSVVVALGLTLLLIYKSEGPKSVMVHSKHDDDGDDDDRLSNNERPRRRHYGHHESPDEGDDGDDHDLGDDGGESRGKKQWDFDFGLAAKYRKELIGHRNSDKRAEVLEGILNGSVNLVDIANDNVRPSTDGSYEGLDGRFCKLNFAVHKNDPSNRKYDAYVKLFVF